MANTGSNAEWTPSTASVTPEDFKTCAVLILHYWEIWNLHDREMDKRLRLLQDDFTGRISIRSCDTDREENWPLIHGAQNIPAVGCFTRGNWFASMTGLRSVEELRTVFNDWLIAAKDLWPEQPPSH